MLICTMDRPQMLRRCLDAVAGGAAQPRSLVIVDQSRADRRTADIVEEFRARLEPCDVRYLRSAGGMARGQNEGLATVGEPVILVTDDDCIPAADWVRVASELFDSDADLGIVGGRVLPHGPDDPTRVAVATRTSTEASVVDHTNAPWELGSGNNFAIRRDVALAVGGNDERLGPGAPFDGGADMDLFRRVLRTGVAGRYEPRLLVHHERATKAERLARRVPYGYGLGLACSLWRRQGDRGATAIAKRHLAMRLRRLRRAVQARDRTAVTEELLVLWGTVRGLGRGSVVRDPAPFTHLHRP